MTAVGKALLYLELVACFGAATALLATGLVMVPIWVMGAGVEVLGLLGLMSVSDSGPGFWVGLIPLGAVVAGVLGLLGVVRLVHLSSGPGDVLVRPDGTLGLIAAGVLGLCLYSMVVQPTDPRAEPVEFAVLFVMPLLGTLHLLYLARRSVFRRPAVRRKQ